MDGFVGRDLVVVADLPGSGAGTVTVIDPLGNVVRDGASASALSSQRLSATIPAGESRVPGIWECRFQRGSLTRVVEILVGQERVALPLVDVLAQIAGNLAPVIEGVVTEVSPDGTVIEDATLVGGQDTWSQHWVVVHPEDDLANGLVSRVVVSSSGGSLVLSAPFPAPLVPGTRYLLMGIAPNEVIRALRTAIAEYADLARIRVDAQDLPVSVTGAPPRREVRVPRGFTHIYEILVDDGIVAQDAWYPVPGRKVVLLAEVERVTLRGLVSLRAPTQPLSRIPVEPMALVHLAAALLHAARSRGPGLDVEEHLRRLMVALQVADGSLSRLAGRVPHGAVPILN